MVRRIALFCVFAAALLAGGCAKELQDFKNTVAAAVNVYERVTTATVSPQQINVAANGWDVVKSSATAYLNYCIAQHLGTGICSADHRRTVIKLVRTGTAARNGLEPYILTGGAGPGDIYNQLVDAVNGLNQEPIKQIPAN